MLLRVMLLSPDDAIPIPALLELVPFVETVLLLIELLLEALSAIPVFNKLPFEVIVLFSTMLNEVEASRRTPLLVAPVPFAFAVLLTILFLAEPELVIRMP
jgi:hypothetical protein